MKKSEELRVATAAAAAEAQRKADDEKRIAAETEARNKAEEVRIAAAAAADAQRKSDDDKKRAEAEAEVKRKAEEARLAALEVQRRADKKKVACCYCSRCSGCCPSGSRAAANRSFGPPASASCRTRSCHAIGWNRKRLRADQVQIQRFGWRSYECERR